MEYKNILKGKAGEKKAVKFVRKVLKYRILEKNYKTKLGEIDIIASNGDTIVFIEVKTREDKEFLATPSEAITRSKIRNINQVASIYLSRYQLRNVPCRFDVIEVFLSEDKIEHIENAFTSYLY